MKDTIIFRISVNEEESYGALANFIFKREHHLNLTDDEVNLITYKYYLGNTNERLRDWAKIISSDDDKYETIKTPQDIRNITEKFEVIYCIYVEKNTDIVDIHNLFLIRRYYQKLRMIMLYKEYDIEEFFKISQFLYLVNGKDKNFYNSCYFVNGSDVKRAQLNNIDFSRNFIPLQVVDKSDYDHIFQNMKGLLDEEDIHKILTEEGLKNQRTVNDLLKGTIKLLHDKGKWLSGMDEHSLFHIFQGMDAFAFILLCYVVCFKKEKFNLAGLEQLAYVMQQYSGAVRQLAENIVFHSRTGFGVIAFRVHKKESAYIEKKYGVKRQKQNSDFLEIIVSDFCGDEPFENIADNFVAHLEEGDIKEKFKTMRPEDFFNHVDGSEMEAVWQQFYQNPDNIGKHFGLRIFRSVVSSFEGFFGAVSHKGYTNEPGDSFLSYQAHTVRACMPGTRYHIVFPVMPLRQIIKKQDISLDSGISISRNIRSLLDYQCTDMDILWRDRTLQSQEEKNEQIRCFSRYIQKKLNVPDYNIMYMSTESVDIGAGELFAKALIMALYHLKRDVVVVCYQCSDNLKKAVFDTVRVFFRDADLEGMFFEKRSQIVLYTKEFEEAVLDLSSAYNTDNINAYISHMKCISAEEKIRPDADSVDLNRGAERYLPCDVLHEVEISGKKQTLFEHYTELILGRSIQRADFGCKLEHTHMRLGSTIHIDSFYEAEILFGNKLFISRFAWLLVKDMIKVIRDIEKLTLYGYGTYSETVLVQMIEMIQNYYPEKTDIDYIILEREEERRGFLHKDRIRYNRHFQSREDRIKHFRDRKVAVIVLINSTLKTHARLINLFKDENDKNMKDEEWLIRNFAVLLVGGDKKNGYWKVADDREVELLNGNILPIPRYFVRVCADYEAPLQCEYCYPPNPVAEIPLIEVNAASTIPNQAFGIIDDFQKSILEIDASWIQNEEKKIAFLKGKFIYGHVKRNENHFLYYFKTENIWIDKREEIRTALNSWKETCDETGGLDYHMIVAPLHYSNAGFVEMVNNVVFGGNAILLRIDFDKEYRCNAYTKYSYLRKYVDQLRTINLKGTLHVHYVDDAIISGRTFHRAKSLVESVLEVDYNKKDSVNIQIFDKVFVLVDRNSAVSRLQYVRQEKDFYAFIHVNISSMRSYGDSCVCCKLKKEADFLRDMSSTEPIADYWERHAKDFELYTLEDYEKRQKEIEGGKKTDKEVKQADHDRAFRRLFCTHMAQCVLEENYHGNDKVQTMYLILKLLNTDYALRGNDKYEYFLSYLKCISRPFLVFKKCVREAVFDILLLLIDAVVTKKKLQNVISEVAEEKAYLSERRLKRQFKELNDYVLDDSHRTEREKQDLVKILMKQLTELKSNYIIRPEKMNAIFAFMGGVNQKEFEVYYMSLIGRLVSANSDTNKSIWLDAQMDQDVWGKVPQKFLVWLQLENTRAFRDGIEKFYMKRTLAEEFCGLSDQRIEILKKNYDYCRVKTMFEDFMKKNKEELDAYDNSRDLSDEAADRVEERIQRFIRSLPALPTVNFMEDTELLKKDDGFWRNGKPNWSGILKKNYGTICREYKAAKDDKEGQIEKQLQRLINGEADIYQYSNFYQVLERDGYANQLKVNPEGIDMIICCTKVLHLCRNNDLKVLDKVQELAHLFKVILDAQKIQFIVEDKDDNYLGKWKKNIEQQYNEIVASWNDSNGGDLSNIHISDKEHYTVIIEKSELEDYNTEVSTVTEALLDELRGKEEGSRNYIIDQKNGVVIWKLENKQKSIWVNIENSKWSTGAADGELKMARDMRRIMVFYQELRKEIFNPENDDFINEISRINRKLNIYDSNKVYTHAKDFSQATQYRQVVQNIEEGGMEQKDLKCYLYYVLNLLADMNVSKYYRNGLRRKLYTDQATRRTSVKWENFSTLLKDGREFIYRSDKEGEVSVKLSVHNIAENEEVLCRGEGEDFVREVTLLIYALILNAAERGRGKREMANKDGQRIGQHVIVSLYSEDDFLVIENKCEEPVDVEKVKRTLCHVPESEEDGISLWSFGCYIKRCINSYIMEKIKEIKYVSNKNTIEKKYIVDMGKWILMLTGEACEIQLEQRKEEGDTYFKVKLPIFMKKYNWIEAKKGGDNE